MNIPKTFFTITVFTITGLLFLHSCKTQQAAIEKPKPPRLKVSVDPETITQGESTKISWISNADTVFFAGEPDNIYPGTHSIQLEPQENTTYKIVAKKNNLTKSYTVDITVKEKPKPQKYSDVNSVMEKHLYSKGNSDGRFTIGTAEGQRLMYGYPIPTSTSHIILKVDDAFASNYPGFKTEYDTVYFSGDQRFSSDAGSLQTEITFMLDSVFITQALTPVDENLEAVKPGTFGQYYHISYKIENMTSEEKQVGFMTLLDLMLDNNDAAETYFDKNMLTEEHGYAGEQIPDRFITLHTKDDFAGFASETILNGGEARKPDSLFIGQWGPFHRFIWDVQTSGKPFGDSGYLLKWNERTLASGDSIMLSYYYGLPSKGHIRVLMNDNKMKTKQLTVFFDKIGSRYLSPQARHQIDSLTAENIGIMGGVIEGYGDALGSEEANLKISQRRIQSVVHYLNSKGIQKQLLIPKPYGETRAVQNEETEEKGNRQDRKTVITLYYSE